MTQSPPTDRPTDADLVAYLDEELAADRRTEIARWLDRDAELQQRLTLLAGGARSFREAFEPLLTEAPLARLQGMLAVLPADRSPGTEQAPPKGARLRSRPRLAWIWPRLPLIAAGLALFLVGAGADRWLASWRDGDDSEATGESENDWRQAVAEYISLYSPDTLTAIPDDAAPRQGELTLVGSKLGAALPLEQISLPGLTLKRAQLLEYDKKPLAQLAYLDSKSGVVALCIYGDAQADSAATSERRAGLNIVHWSAHGRAFMLVGHAEMPELQRLAGLLSQKLTL